MGEPRYQPRYVAYAKAHGKAPEEMPMFDRERYPGGPGAGFMLWISEQWTEYERHVGYDRRLHGFRDLWRAGVSDAFEEWLLKKYGVATGP